MSAEGRPPTSVLVGLGNPHNMLQLLDTAKRLAAVRGGAVVPFCVSRSDYGQVGERLYEAARKCCCDVAGVTEPLRVEAPSLAQGLAQAAAQSQPELVLLGYSPLVAGDRTARKNFERLVQRVAGELQLNLIVANYGALAEVRHVLIPLASTVNLRPIGWLARALSSTPGGDVTLAQLLPEEASLENHYQAATFLRAAAREGHLVQSCQFRVESHSDPAEGMVEMSWEYEAVILGAPEKPSRRGGIFGEVADHVATWSHCTVFIVRAGGK